MHNGIRLDSVIEAYKKDMDRTLIRQDLKLRVEDRFRKAMAVARLADELRRAGREARAGQGGERGQAALSTGELN